MMKRNNLLKSAFCAIAVLIIIAGCSTDNGVGPLAPSHEPVKFGTLNEDLQKLKITQDGKTVALVREATVEGIVTVLIDRDSEVFEVEFVDKNGEQLNFDKKNYNLTWKHPDSEIASFEQSDELKEWQFHVYGKKSGNTTFELRVKNSWGFLEYSSPPIPLEVN